MDGLHRFHEQFMIGKQEGNNSQANKKPVEWVLKKNTDSLPGDASDEQSKYEDISGHKMIESVIPVGSILSGHTMVIRKGGKVNQVVIQVKDAQSAYSDDEPKRNCSVFNNNSFQKDPGQ